MSRKQRSHDHHASTPPVSKQQLTQAQDDFISSWGQMGSTWGISRTMAEIHALLYITGQPMCTDEVMERLAISRGNASMSLRALLDWGIVSKVHKRGDRKEYFQAELDVWTLSRKVIAERLRREIHPILANLAEIRDLTPAAEQADATHAPTTEHVPDQAIAGRVSDATPQEIAAHNERLDKLIELTQMIDTLGERFVSTEGKGLRAVANLISRVV